LFDVLGVVWSGADMNDGSSFASRAGIHCNAFAAREGKIGAAGAG